jgi:hypothetical protein
VVSEPHTWSATPVVLPRTFLFRYVCFHLYYAVFSSCRVRAKRFTANTIYLIKSQKGFPYKKQDISGIFAVVRGIINTARPVGNSHANIMQELSN